LATEQFVSKSSAAIAKHDAAINKVSHSATLIGAGLLAGVTAVVATTARFDKAMSAVSATGEDARQNIDGLRKAAIDMGAQTAFSATEAAQGIENLLKAGVSAKDVLGGGLKGALDLAAAGNLEVGDAAEIAATAMTQFNLTGAQVPHIADLLAAGAGKAQGEVADMGMALKQGGLVASQFGLSIEETVGTLSAFASAGLLGSDAGTSFKTMLLQLAAPSKQAANAMDDLGIAAYDAQGKFIGTTALAGQLQDRLGKLSQKQRDAALATIFGTDAIRAANILYKQGAKGIAEWVAKTNEAGYAAKVARERLNNLSGDLEALRGSIESTFINSGSDANATLRDLTQGANSAVNAIGRLPKPVLETGLKLTALTGIGLLAFGGLGKLATSGLATRNAFKELAATSPRAARGVATVGKAAGVASAAVVGLQLALGSSSKFQFAADVDAIANALLKLGSSRVDLDSIFTMRKGTLDNINGFGDALDRVVNPRVWDRLGQLVDGIAGTTAAATDQMRKNFEGVDKAISSLSPEDAQRAFRDMAAQATAAGVPIDKLVQLFPQYAEQVRQAGQATGRTSHSTAELADWMANGLPPGAISSAQALARAAIQTGRVSSEAQQAQKQLREVTNQMFSAAKAAIELQGTEDGVQAAIDDATKAAKTNGKTLDNNTEKGRNNREALRNLATASNAYREKLIEQGASQKRVTNATEDGRRAFIRSAEKMGLSRKRAEELANKFGLLDTKINSLNDKRVDIKFHSNVFIGNAKSPRGRTVRIKVPINAAGGPISGPGTGTSDSILGLDRGTGMATSWVSDGEYVINKKSTDKYRPLIEAINANALAGGGVVNPKVGPFPKGAMDVPGDWDRAVNMWTQDYTKSLEKAMAAGVAKSMAAMGGSGGFTHASGGTWRAIGRAMMLQRWPASQWPALNSLWTRESGWNPHARNPSSGAYGIPQGLPPSKMGSAAAHGNGRAQIAWGLNYIRSRYGSPARAWAHSQRTGWYSRGGQVRPRNVTSYRHATGGPVSGGWGGGGSKQEIHHHYINVAVNMPNGGNSEAQAAALGRRIASDLAAKGV
jgi:TP901 family phage tail tape measure protein